MNSAITRLQFARTLAILASLALAASPAQGGTITLGTLSESTMVGLKNTNPAIAPTAPGDGWFTGAYAGTIRGRQDTSFDLRTQWNFRFNISAISGIAPGRITGVTLSIPQIGRHTATSVSQTALTLRANTYDWHADGTGAGYPVFNGPYTVAAAQFGSYDTHGQIQDRTNPNVEGTFVLDSATYPELLTVVQGWAANPAANEGFALGYFNAADTGLAFGTPTLVVTLAGGGAGSPFLDAMFNYSVSSNITYGQGDVGYPTKTGTKTLKLDLYLPTGAGLPEKRPALICIHGGGFIQGSSMDNGVVEICQAYARRGYVTASINYRLQGDNPSAEPGLGNNTDLYERTYNAAVQDAAKAVRWLRANAEALKIDPTRIAIQGSSAGSATALSVGYLEADIIGNNAQVGAVVDFWGSLEQNVSQVDANDPPLFILHGTADPMVPYVNATNLAQRCTEVGVPYELYPIVGGVHSIFSSFWNEVVDGKTIDRHCAEFLFRHLNLLPLHPVAATQVEPLSLNQTNSTLPLRFLSDTNFVYQVESSAGLLN
ncbi:MAG: alpha/beta hydrolase fold domain-containing protein [Chthoniobacteraceae bacterium]